MGDEPKSINAKLDPEKRRRIRIEAAKQDMSMSDWLRDAIDEKLDRESESESELSANN